MALVFFWFFLVFFGIGFGQNSKLKTGFFCFFFWFFLAFFGIFWHKPWPTFEIGNWFFGLHWFFFWFFLVFLGFFGFFWYLNLGLEYHPKKYQKKPKKNKKKQKKPKKPKKNQKKPVATPKLVNWLGFFGFFLVFLFFWGEHPPPPVVGLRVFTDGKHFHDWILISKQA